MGATLSAAREEVCPAPVPVEQMPRNVNAGSGVSDALGSRPGFIPQQTSRRC